MGFLFSLLRADVRLGHAGCGFGVFLDRSVPRETFEGRHVVDAMTMIASLAGGVGDGKGIDVFWNANVAGKWEGFFAPFEKSPLIGINPGGDRENRRWHRDRFAAVAEKIVERFNARIILLGGPMDKNIASNIESRIKYDISNLSGEIPLDELPYVISRLDMLVTNDSGPMHIAAATRTPLVALFGPEDPNLFGPYTKPELYRILYKGGSDFAGKEENKKGLSFLDMITPEDVLSASAELLENRRHH
jgi:heptosyltransferase-2